MLQGQGPMENYGVYNFESPLRAKASPYNKRKLTESRTVFNHQASILDENRIVMYKKGKHISGGYYIVEISSTVS